MPRLKIFCTTSGFYDHIVAAPSRPAALKAWGARTDLFSMGVAREVTDARTKKKALERPGEVIRMKRSGAGKDAPEPRPAHRPKRAAQPPSRTKLKAAEQKLAELEQKQATDREPVERQLKALQKKIDQLDARHAKARAAAELKLEQARETYEAALEKWPG